ncbi:MAG: hypothetical protein AAFY50_09880 [Cyanobacteria bacterium J06648_1]
MKQISNRKQSVSYLYYFLVGLSLVAEPFFLKLIFATYLPGFYYSALTTPIGVVLAVVGLQKLQKANGNTTIRQTIAAIRQDYANLLDPEFRKIVLSRYEIDFKTLFNSLKSIHSQEPAVHKHSKKAREHFYIFSIFATVFFSCTFCLFVVNLSRWGWFETGFTSTFYLFLICLTGIAYLPAVISSTKQLKNAKISEADLKELLKMLREELRDWQFESRKVFPTANLTAKGNNIDRDIDVLGISPDDNYFIIDLKSHIGDVFWISRVKNLRRQFGRNTESIPFEKDFFNQLHGGAKRVQDFYKLSREPDKILLFWRAMVKINKSNRIKRGVLISNKEMLVRDLKKRDLQLAKRRLRSSNSNHTIHS